LSYVNLQSIALFLPRMVFLFTCYLLNLVLWDGRAINTLKRISSAPLYKI